MTDVVIVGAGGYGIEAYDLIYRINQISRGKNGQNRYNILGFLDDTKDTISQEGIDVPVLGGIADYEPVKEVRYILGIANPHGKEKVASILKTRGAVFETLTAPTTVMDEGVVIGEGCTFKDGSIVSRGAIIGNFVNVCGCVGGSAVIGDYSTMGAYCNITDAIIGKRVFVGSHSFIMNKKKIGDDVVIGAGSIVVNNIRSGVTVFGNPAKVISR